MTVFKVNVNLGNMDEETEEETGLYIPFNDDDDNSDTIPDYQQHPVEGEDDLREVVLSCVPPFMLESFQNRKKYKENVQVKIAEVLVYTFKDYQILPQLEKMKKEIKDKILKSRIEMLIKKIQKINRTVNIKK